MIDSERKSEADPFERVTTVDSRVEQLFRDHNVALISFLKSRLHSEADAREAAQEAYVRLLQLDQPHQPSFLRAYLFKVASNVATDLMRRRAVRNGGHESDLYEPAVQPTQERALVARQQLQAAELALRELPPNCREAFVLSRQEEWRTARIAVHLGVSERMVRMYLVRALEHIQHSIEIVSSHR